MNKAVDAGPNIRLMKIVVIVLGVLMLAAAGGVVIGLVRTFSGAVTGKPAATPAQPVIAAAPLAPGTVLPPIVLPKGARVLTMAPAGASLALMVELRDGNQRLLLLDPTTGAVTGTLEVRAE